MNLEQSAKIVGKALIMMAAAAVAKSVIEEALQQEFKISHEDAVKIVGIASVAYDLLKK